MQLRATRLTAIATAVRRVLFSPAQLFAAGEQGVWYDPSDFSTMFQDAAGTTPVTAVEQPVGLILDKSKGLVLGSELVTNGGFDSNTTGWTSINEGAATTTSISGVCVLNPVDEAGVARLRQSFTVVVGKTYLVSIGGVADTGSPAVANVGTTGGRAEYFTVPSNKTAVTYAQYVTAVTTTMWISLYKIGTILGTYQVDNISVRELPGNHATQATATSRPVLSARVNRLAQTENLAGPGWSRPFGGTGILPVVTPGFEAPDGTLTAFRLQLDKGTGTTASDLAYLTAISFVASALTKTSSIWMKSLSGTPSIVFRNNGNNNNLTTISNEWALYSLANVAVTPAVDVFQIMLRGSFNTSNSCDLLLWHPDDRASNYGVGLPSYQRVNTATDYDTAGFPMYLRFDGVDDQLGTTFGTVLGSACTVAIEQPGSTPVILTAQTIGTTYATTTSNAGLVIVNRALTSPETTSLTAYLTAKGAS